MYMNTYGYTHTALFGVQFVSCLSGQAVGTSHSAGSNVVRDEQRGNAIFIAFGKITLWDVSILYVNVSRGEVSNYS